MPNFLKQRTLRNPICAQGIALHSGEQVHMRLLPAPQNHGIVFRRVDLSPPATIPAHAHRVAENTELATVLCTLDGTVTVSTIEHLLSSLAGLGVDNAIIELDHKEMPIMDGSADSFVFLVQSAGVVEQDAAKQFIQILEPVEVTDDDKKAAFLPHNGFRITCSIEFDHPLLNNGNIEHSIDFSLASFVKEVSRARTFGFKKDIAGLHARRFALGGSLDNAILLDDTGVVNAEGLRFPNTEEFVRHKILDAFGDLYLAGHAIIGEFKGHKSGHRLNNLLLRCLLERPQSFKTIRLEDNGTAPVFYAGSLLPAQ